MALVFENHKLIWPLLNFPNERSIAEGRKLLECQQVWWYARTIKIFRLVWLSILKTENQIFYKTQEDIAKVYSYANVCFILISQISEYVRTSHECRRKNLVIGIGGNLHKYVDSILIYSMNMLFLVHRFKLT